MARIDLDATMDAIAATAVSGGATTRAYAIPEDNVEVPCMVVGYPDEINYDMTFRDGSDEATFPVWFLVGLVVDRAARKSLSDIIGSAPSIKAALDGNLGGVVQTARVERVRIETATVGSVQYLAARFDLNVVT